MKTIRKLAVVLTAIMIIAFAAVTAGAADSIAASADTDRTGETLKASVDTAQAYKQLNSYRSRYNRRVKNDSRKLGKLRKDRDLEKIALIRAKEMAETGRFSHTRPNGQRGISLIRGRKAKGENIARGQKTCAEVSAAWYNSPGHRANMLRKCFKRVGIAAYTCNGTTYWVQIYSS